MKDLSYTTIFPNKKTISHEESLKEKVKSNIVHIIMEENKISEKAFSKFDQVINLVKDKFSEEMLKFALNEYESGKRLKYISEILYNDYFKNEPLNETKVSKYKDFY